MFFPFILHNLIASFFYLEISKDPHLYHLSINERLSVLRLVKLRGTTSHVILAFPLRSVKSEQTSEKNQPLGALHQRTQM